MTDVVAYPVDHLASCLPFPLCEIPLAASGAQACQRHARFPELHGVVDRLRHLQSLAQVVLGVLPSAPGQCELPSKPPPLHEVLPGSRAGGSLQTFVCVPTCLIEVSAGKRQFPEAREEVDRVAPAHPLARRGGSDETKDAFEILPSRDQVARQQRDIAEVELGVGKRLVVTTLPAAIGCALVEL